jgi:ABC-type transport system involved in cytochrome bd biosynthesis fused ATPase/permease subunit
MSLSEHRLRVWKRIYRMKQGDCRQPACSLDASTERCLLNALDRFADGKIRMVIAHRLSAARWANRVLVLAGGEIAEQGSHATLYQRTGLYRKLCNEVLTNDMATRNAAEAQVC